MSSSHYAGQEITVRPSAGPSVGQDNVDHSYYGGPSGVFKIVLYMLLLKVDTRTTSCVAFQQHQLP